MPNLSLKPEEADYVLNGMFPGEGPELRDRSFVSNDPGMPKPEAGPERPEPSAPSVSSPLGTIASTSEMGQPARPVVGGKNYPRQVAALGTIDRAQEDASLHDYQASHPWGTPDNHPGLGGKIAHVLGKIGGTALSVASPGVAAMFPQTPLGRIVQQRQDLGNISGLQKEKGEEDLRKANIEHLGAETDALRNPQKDANPDDWKVVPDTNWLVNSKTGETKQAEGVPTPEGKGSEEEKAYKQALATDPKLTRAAFHDTWQSAGKQDKSLAEEEAAYQEAVKKNPNVTRLQFHKQWADAGKEPREPNQYADWKKQHPGGTPEEFASSMSDAKLQETSTTRTMQEAAPKVQYFIQRLNPMIDKLAKELGPGAGRWSEFWAGKVGTSNPEYTKLRTDVGLLQTLLMRMHVGSRGGEYIMKHFQDLIDQGKQSPENLKAALGEISSYATEVAGGQGGNGTPPAGAKVRDYTQLGK